MGIDNTPRDALVSIDNYFYSKDNIIKRTFIGVDITQTDGECTTIIITNATESIT